MATIRSIGYSIHVSEKNALKEFLEKQNFSSISVLVDENTRELCLPIISDELPTSHVVIEIPSGERNKNLKTCQKVWDAMLESGMNRNSLCINLGGGVIGDLGGFCASTYMRGIAFLQMPTTLLAMVDASIGGKLGVDFRNFKNYIGLFKNPAEVIIHPQFLESLPIEQISSGFAEMLKHGLILDQDYWKTLVNITDLSEVNWSGLISRSILIKKQITEQDPLEKGQRKLLNFGHTLGHALETAALQSNKPLLHGEAIALGMLAESYLSNRHSKLSMDDLQTIEANIKRFYKDLFPHEMDKEVILDLATKDKKNNRGNINCSLLTSLGTAKYDYIIPRALARESLSFINS